ncbi:MAG: hypothetical protein JSS66_02105 [Armatimonadetes bacterium]|nr:hypothetical protein [Armatimonadota bacterium]
MKASNLYRAGGAVSAFVGVLLMGSLVSLGTTTSVPVGGLNGRVLMDPSGKPLPNAEIVAIPMFDLPEGSPSNWSTRADKDGKFHFRSLPSGPYTIDAYGVSHHNSKRVVAGVFEGKSADLEVHAERSMAELELMLEQSVFTPKEALTMELTGSTDQSTVKIKLVEVPLSSLLEKRDPSTVVNALVGKRTAWDPTKTPGIRVVRNEELPIAQRDIEGHYVSQMKLDPLPEGQYLLHLQVGSDVRMAWLTVSSIALVTKFSQNEALAYVTDIESGKSIPGCDVSYVFQQSLKSAGSTSSDGTLKFKMPKEDANYRLIVARRGSSWAMSWFYGSRGAEGKTVLWTQTDRPVYRPGDKVSYKIVGRDSTPNGYNVPTGPVTIVAKDSDDTEIGRWSKTFNEDGAVWGDFKTNPYALPGPFFLEIESKHGRNTATIPVESYRKPQYQVTVKPVTPVLVRGDRATFKVHVETFTGEPAVGVNLNSTIYRKPDWSYRPFAEDSADDDEYESDSSYMGDYVEYQKGTTDGNGDTTVSFATDTDKSPVAVYEDAVMSVEASASDESGQSSTGKGSVRVLRGLVSLDSDVDRYIVPPGKDVNLRLRSTTNGGDAPAAGQEVSVVYGHERWNEQSETFIEEGKAKIVLDSSGTGLLTLKPTTTGTFLAKCSTRDARGNEVRSETYVWVETGGESGAPMPSLKLILDKRSYAPDESATVLLQTDSPGGSALVTIETDRVLWSRVVPLQKSSTTVQIDGLAQYAPNAMVCAAYVNEKRYYSSQRSLNVDLRLKRINVAVTPDTARTTPGAPVSYTIKTLDPAGRPVSADVAVGVVDESVYSVLEDTNDPVKAFYPRRWSSVETSYSFPEVYLDGEDKTPKNVKIRRNFQDTAAWMPSVHTDANGNAKVSLKLPDNLTKWRATAVAFTRATEIGKAMASVVAEKDLMVRLGLPQFMVEGDSQRVTASVANNTDHVMETTVQMSTDGLTVDGAASSRISLQPRQTQQLIWVVTAPRLGTAKVKVVALSGSANDGVEQSVGVKVHGRTVEELKTGAFDGTGEVTVNVDPAAIGGQLQISASPTLLTSLLPMLPGLVDYPYGCTEQTTSRFVPALMVGQLMRAAGLRDVFLESKISEVSQRSLARLRMLQSSDGGWGWFEYDQPEPWMTGYALEGLARARSAGVAVSPHMVDRGLSWANQQLKDKKSQIIMMKPSELDDWIYLAGSVTRFGPSEHARAFLLAATNFKAMSTEALSAYVLAAKSITLSGLEPAVAELMRRAEVTKDYAKWSGPYGEESTGSALEAMIAVQPQSPLIEEAVGLFVQQQTNQWSSTRETARILLAITAYLRLHPEQVTNAPIQTFVNGRAIAPSIEGGMAKITLPLDQLKHGANSVRFTGKGSVYYNVRLSQQVREAFFNVHSGNGDYTLTRDFFTTSPKRMDDGTVRLITGTAPIHKLKSGDIVRCRLTFKARTDVSRLIVEVPIPSNMRIVDSDEPTDGATWNWWWNRSVFTDDKAVVFGSLQAGSSNVIEFAVRAEAPGKCEALPCVAYRMYQPDERVETTGYSMEVVQR